MSEPEAEPKHETTRLGSYTIVRKLARGGMAELFLARSVGPEGFEKLVVLKKILPKYAENPRFVQLFLDEAKLAASLDHPHIAHVYDMGRVDGHYFFTMEYVHGQDLRSILRRTERAQKKTPIELAVQIVRNVASALHYAHERRRPDGTLRDIVHRDVSPSNVLVSYDGTIKLVDFGVAKTAASSVRTRTGTLKGKVGYMSPEQARGMSIDRRSDVFSLGVVLWELVSIKRLFKCDNDLATIQAIINMPPQSLVELRDDCPPELDRIVKRALEKEPATRYQTAQELQRDLEELARDQRMNQSSIALSNYLSELFQTELAALKEAQSSGQTVTDYVVQTDLTTPVSESDLSVSDDEEPSEPEEEPEEEASDPTAMPPQLAPTAGMIQNDAELEATAIGAPPLMLDSQITKIPLGPGQNEVFEGGATAVHDNPFADTVATSLDNQEFRTAVRPNPFGEELPTVQSELFPDERPTTPVSHEATTAMGGPLVTPATGTPSVYVQPQTPPTGIPAMPMPPPIPRHSQPHMGHPMTPGGGMPVQYPVVHTQHAPTQPELAINLTPQKKLVILGAIAVVLLILVVILAVVASGGGGTEPAAVPDAAEVKPEPPKPPAPKVEPPKKIIPKPVVKPADPPATPAPPAQTDGSATAAPADEPPPADAGTKRLPPGKTIKVPKR